jgi:hypothetical protein
MRNGKAAQSSRNQMTDDKSTPSHHEHLHGYVERYCAFIDILGFRGLIGNIRSDNQFIALREVLRKIHAPVDLPTVNWHTDFRAQSISDAVAISTLASDGGLIRLFRAIEDLALDLLNEGYFIRGALVRGRLYHDSSMVFGEALVRAFELENSVARYPRVMISREVMADIDRFCTGIIAHKREEYFPFIEQADDGPHFVHVLRTVADTVQRVQLDNLNKPPDKQQKLEQYERLQDMIQMRLDEATDNPRHFEKVQWFALYWRKFIPYGVSGFKMLVGPGMNRVEWTTG